MQQSSLVEVKSIDRDVEFFAEYSGYPLTTIFWLDRHGVKISWSGSEDTSLRREDDENNDNDGNNDDIK